MKGDALVNVETAPWSLTKASPQDALDMTGLPQTTCQCNWNNTDNYLLQNINTESHCT
jgi:hypothetical protein